MRSYQGGSQGYGMRSPQGRSQVYGQSYQSGSQDYGMGSQNYGSSSSQRGIDQDMDLSSRQSWGSHDTDSDYADYDQDVVGQEPGGMSWRNRDEDQSSSRNYGGRSSSNYGTGKYDTGRETDYRMSSDDYSMDSDQDDEIGPEAYRNTQSGRGEGQQYNQNQTQRRNWGGRY